MPVTIEDAGICKKKLSFEIPRDDIQAKVDETLDELTKTAQVPGFRPGHAPKRLVQKKLRDEIQDQVKAELISEAYKKAVEEHHLDVLREEEFDPETVELPDDGPMVFDVQIEVKPEIVPPDLSDIQLQVPRVEVSDDDVRQAVDSLRRARGRFVEQNKTVQAAERDMLTADVRITADGETLFEAADGTLAVVPQAIGGIRIDRLAEELSGKKAGDTAVFSVTIPDDYETESLRGKEAEVAVTVKAVRRIEMPPLDDDFAKSLGVDTVADLEKGVRERIEGDASDARDAARRDALAAWLLDRVPLEVPEGVAEANAGRVFNQQVVSLQRRGVPIPQIEERAEELMEACRNRAQRDLKLAFILEAIAKDENIETTEDELQARVRLIADNYGRPTDRMYEELEKRGHLDALREQIRDDKVYQTLLSKATVTEVEPPRPEPPEETRSAEPAESAEPAAPVEAADSAAPAESAGPAKPEKADANKGTPKRKKPKAAGDDAPVDDDAT